MAGINDIEDMIKQAMAAASETASAAKEKASAAKDVAAAAKDAAADTASAAKDAASTAKGIASDLYQTAGDLAEKYRVSERAASAVAAAEQGAEYAAKKMLETAEEISDRDFNHPDISRNAFMLKGDLAEKGYDWWWHSFTGHNAKTGEEKNFFIEFFCINPALAEDEPVLGQLPENKENGKLPSYMMIKAGVWGRDAKQMHRFFPWNSVTVSESVPFQVSADNCYLSEDRTLGRVSVSEEDAAAHPEWLCDAGDLIWDLKIDKQIAFNVGYGASRAMRDMEAFQMFWHVQGMKTAYEGRVYYNGELYMVHPETSYGYADKNWGSDFTSPWLWLSSCDMTSNLTGKRLADSAFTIGGGRPKVGNHEFEDMLLGAIYLEGDAYEFNFSKFWTLTKTKFRVKEKKDTIIWKVIQETPLSKMYTEVVCKKADMLKVNYEAPDGSYKHKNLWNGGNGTGNIKLYKKSLKKNWEWELVDDIDLAHVGCEYGVMEEEPEKKEKDKKKDKAEKKEAENKETEA